MQICTELAAVDQPQQHVGCLIRRPPWMSADVSALQVVSSLHMCRSTGALGYNCIQYACKQIAQLQPLSSEKQCRVRNSHLQITISKLNDLVSRNFVVILSWLVI